MSLWKYLISAKEEVDDRDLPLPKYRMYDDDGNLKLDEITSPDPQFNVTVLNSKTSAKKSTALSPKTRARLLRSVGASPTAPRGQPKVTAVVKSPLPTKPRELSLSRSPLRALEETTMQRLPSNGSITPERDTASKSQSRATPTRSVSPRKSSPKKTAASKKAVSPRKSSPKRASSAPKSNGSPRKSSPKKTAASKKSVSPQRSSPKRTASSAKSVSPTKQTSSRSSPTRKSTSPARSTSRKATRSPRKPQTKRARSQSTQSSDGPTRRWTVSALRAYAKENDIDISQEKTKSEILNAINTHQGQ